MSFFAFANRDMSGRVAGLSLDLIRRNECSVCPLNHEPGLCHPKMKPTGSNKPLIYVIGEAPGAEEDRRGLQFVGPSGKLLRQYIPQHGGGKGEDDDLEIMSRIRWNNSIRCKPPKKDGKQTSPSEIMLAACFPADTELQSIGGVRKLYRRWYTGPMVVVKTRRGRVLTGTPNHPIFTTRGKTALKHVKVGDYSFCAAESNAPSSPPPNPNKDYKPSSIGQVFGSFGESAITNGVTSVLDFHGDGMINGKVDIVRAAGLLRYNAQFGPYVMKEFSDPVFTLANFTTGVLVRSSDLDHSFGVAAMITSQLPFLRRMGFHPKAKAFGRCSRFDVVSFKEADDYRTANIKLARDCCGAFASSVSTYDLGFGKLSPAFLAPSAVDYLLSLGSQSHPGLYQEFFDRGPICSGQSSQLKEGSSFPVELDDIVSVETISDFRGHVFNLETDSHKYIANGFVVSNCQPSIIRDIEATKPKAIFAFGAVALWLINESGITRWCGRQIPVKVGSHSCWLFPFVHPASILYEESQARYINKHVPYKTELETQFAMQMKAAFAALENLPEPVVWSREDLLVDIEQIDGSGGAADLERVLEFLRDINHEDYVGFDYETNKLRPWFRGARLLSAAWSVPDRAMAVALDHKDAKWTDQQLSRLFYMVKIFLQKRRCRLIAHHLPFELEWTAYTFGRGLLWKGGWEDTESQAFILDERGNGSLSLEFLCMQALGINVKAIDNLDRKNLADAPLPDLLRYNGMDSKCHRLLFESQLERIEQEGLGAVYEHQRDRTIAATAVQMKGIPVDQEVNRTLLIKYATRMHKIERRIAADPEVRAFERRTGKKYRPSAPQDASAFVYHTLGQKLPNSDAKTLGAIDHSVIKDTLRWRQVNKIASTYVLPVTEGGTITVGEIDIEIPRSPHLQDDGIVHSILNTTRTRTNRTSSEDPNVQNWPVRTKQGLEARRQVAPGPDEVVVAFDYSGIQARNVAMESNDRALVEAFFNNYDIHSDWLEKIQRQCERRGVAWIPGGLRAAEADPELHKKYRYNSKNKFVFPSFFGAQPRSIAANLGIPEPVAFDVHEQFWDEFPDIKAWQKRTIKNYYETGYVTGLSGFRRHAPVAHTELINTPIQGDEARIVCDAMIRLSRLGEDPNLEVHDDLTFIWKKRHVEKLSEIVINEMLTISFPWINVPLAVERSIGPNWADKKKAGEFDSESWFGKKSRRAA